MPGRENRKRGGKKRQGNNPLGDDLAADRFAQAKKLKNGMGGVERGEDEDWEHNTSGFVLNAKTTKKIFQRAREQLSQIEEEKEGYEEEVDSEIAEGDAEEEEGGKGSHSSSSRHNNSKGGQFSAPGSESSSLLQGKTNRKTTSHAGTSHIMRGEEEEESATTEDHGLSAILRSVHSAPSPFERPLDEEGGIGALTREERALLEGDDDEDDDATSVISEVPGEEETGLMELMANETHLHSGGGGFDAGKGNICGPSSNNTSSNNPGSSNRKTMTSDSNLNTDASTSSSGGAGAVGPIEAYYGINEEEARLLDRFQPASRVHSRHLSGIIMERIQEQVAEEQKKKQQHLDEGQQEGGGRSGGAHFPLRSSSMSHFIKNTAPPGEEEDESAMNAAAASIDPRIARVYTAIGTLLKRYTSGKIPKAFKVLPNVENWEALLLLTKPEQWSPHAVYHATRIFSAHLNERMAQRFYAAVLLPIVHERIVEEKKLHPALYMAVKKALFKPIAFFKGFLLPLATDEECTLREALIIASILQRTHLPPIPTAVALVKIAQEPFRGPCTVFLRVLIDKQMALPYQAIDALVVYFHRFIHTHSRVEAEEAEEEGGMRRGGEHSGACRGAEVRGGGRRTVEALPVLWHQTLLLFVQRYKDDLTMEQIHLLTQVCSIHFHYLISPEIKRELGAAKRNHLQREVGKA